MRYEQAVETIQRLTETDPVSSLGLSFERVAVVVDPLFECRDVGMQFARRLDVVVALAAREELEHQSEIAGTRETALGVLLGRRRSGDEFLRVECLGQDRRVFLDGEPLRRQSDPLTLELVSTDEQLVDRYTGLRCTDHIERRRTHWNVENVFVVVVQSRLHLADQIFIVHRILGNRVRNTLFDDVIVD